MHSSDNLQVPTRRASRLAFHQLSEKYDSRRRNWFLPDKVMQEKDSHFT